MEALKKMIEDLGRAFETFKGENDKRIKEIEGKGHADPVLAEKVDKINKDIGEISAMKRQLEALENTIGRGVLPGGAKGEREKVIAEHKQAFNKWLRKGHEAGLRELEVRAELSTSSDPEGGYAVPVELSKTIREIATTLSAMRAISDVQTIGTNEYSELVDVGGESAEWVGEKTTRSETDTAGLEKVSWFPKELSALPKVSQSSLDDIFFNVEAWVAKFVARAFAVKEGAAWITGNGVEKPRGIAGYPFVANASYAWGKIGYIAGGHTSLLNSADAIIDLQHALKAPYRPGSTFLTNDTTCAKIRKLKDGEGNYLWRPGLAEGAPDVLLGKPIAYDDNVDSVGANKYPLFYGNFKEGYLIVDRMGIRLLRDPYTSKPYVLFYTTKRTGGGVRNFEAIKALKIATA
jgi:HK97 family phage major capsid protein